MATNAPTQGRVVLFWPRRDDNIAKLPNQGLAAVVAAVHATGKVNLAVFSAKGHVHGYENVIFVQEGDPRPPDGDFAEWSADQKLSMAAAAAALGAAGA